MTTDGRLLCHTGGSDLFEADRVISAVAAAGYAEYATAARDTLEAPASIDFLLFELEEGRLAATPIHDKYLLCCYADATAEIGSIKMKLEAARRDLAEPLARVGNVDGSSDGGGGSSGGGGGGGAAAAVSPAGAAGR